VVYVVYVDAGDADGDADDADDAYEPDDDFKHFLIRRVMWFYISGPPPTKHMPSMLTQTLHRDSVQEFCNYFINYLILCTETLYRGPVQGPCTGTLWDSAINHSIN
jgi:hypothetical protein